MEIEVEAFRADTKASKGLTAAHIAEAASLYDAEKAPAPLVFGHPAHDSPALGLVSSARAEGSKLFLKLKNIADTVVQGVKEGRILGRSIAFWDPDHPSNPNPGKYSIRHLGLLGGQAPAIPGMPALRFSADDTSLESDEPPADAVVYAVEEAPTPVQTITEPAPVKEQTMTLEEQLAAATARAEAAEAEAAKLAKAEETRVAEFAAAEKTRREAENLAAIDKAVSDGKVLPAEKDDLVQIFNALPTNALTFAAGELEPRKALETFLDKLPKRAPVGDKPASPTEFSASSTSEAADAAARALKEANERKANAFKAPVPA